MIVNRLLFKIQKIFSPIYEKSFVLQKLDILIGLNIFLLIFSSTFAQSDSIGYFALFAIILTAIKFLVKPKEHFKMNIADLFLLFYFIFVLISLAGSSLFILSLKGFEKTFMYLGFYVSFIHYLKDNRKMIKYILLAFLTCSVFEFFPALIQNFQSVSEISGWQDISRLNPEEVMTRVYGTLKPYNPNLFGGYMVSILPSALVAIFLPLKNKHYKTALFGLVCFIASICTIIMTGCRGAYLALFAEIVLIAVFTFRMLKPFYKKIFGFLCGVVSVISAFVIVILPSLRARIFSIFAFRQDSSNSFRFNIYNSCFEMLKDNWLLGIGCGNQNFREVYGLYMKTGFDALSAYNIYLEIAVENGIFALLSFFGFLFYTLSKAINYIFKRHNIKTIYLLIAVVSLTGMLIHGFVDTVFFRPQIQFTFWIMVGIIRVAVCRRHFGNVHEMFCGKS